MNEQELLAKKIVNIRESLDMSQLELAQKANIERTALNKIEKGTRKVSSDELKRLALALHKSSDSLLNISTNNEDISDTDLDEMLDNAHSYDGKPMNDHDREIIKTYLKGYFQGKN
ncbi:helix-turn-helix domain-containing protein [Lactobacillus crispatus]|nr:helix-turn-helix domain-containing protein [Lactobacillus crispatus]